MQQKPIYLKTKYANIPKGTKFDIYAMSYSMFALDYIYCVVYNKKDVIIPDTHITFENPNIKENPLKNALELLVRAEQELFDNSVIGGTNDYRSFLEANGVIIERSYTHRLCKDCKKEIEVDIYCEKCTWSHEPGY